MGRKHRMKNNCFKSKRIECFFFNGTCSQATATLIYISPIRRCFDVYTTSITLKRRRMDVKTTSCAYWAYVLFILFLQRNQSNIFYHYCISLFNFLKRFICCTSKPFSFIADND